ncbi:hypothetical protein SVIRM249S_02202 [Streptomyces viridochromogenes]
MNEEVRKLEHFGLLLAFPPAVAFCHSAACV